MRYMGKDSLWKSSRLGALFIAARAPSRCTGAAPTARRCAARIEVIEAGEPLVMFPEGTRQAGPVVEQLFEGAAYVATRTGVPIVPVGIGGSERAMPKGSKLLRPVKLHVVVGPALRPKPAGGGQAGLPPRGPRAHRAAPHRAPAAVRRGPDRLGP